MLNRRAVLTTAALAWVASLLSWRPSFAASAASRLARVPTPPPTTQRPLPLGDESRAALEALLVIERLEDIGDAVDSRELFNRYQAPGLPAVPTTQSPEYWDRSCPVCQHETAQVSHSHTICTHCDRCYRPADLLAAMEGCCLGDAVVRIERMVQTGELVVRAQQYARHWEIMEAATTYYHEILVDRPEGAEARRWLTEYGLTEDTIRTRRLGFGPWQPSNGLSRHLLNVGFTRADLASAGLRGLAAKRFRKRDVCARNALIVPAPTAKGFVGRLLDQPLFGPWIERANAAAFDERLGSDQIKRCIYPAVTWPEDFQKYEDLLLLDSPLDVLLLRQAGLSNVFCFTSAQPHPGPRTIRTVSAACARIVMVARRSATLATQSHFVLGFAGYADRVAFLPLEEGETLRTVLQARGADGIRARIAAAKPLASLLEI